MIFLSFLNFELRTYFLGYYKFLFSRLSKYYGWTWICVNSEEDNIDICQRVLGDLRLNTSMTLNTCSMICAPGRNIWPLPTGNVKVKNTTASFLSGQLKIGFKSVNNKEVSNLLLKMAKVYEEKVFKLAKTPQTRNTNNSVTVLIQLTKKENCFRYRINIDESYRLSVSQKGSGVQVLIKASTFLGAHHGLETLLQLIWWDEKNHVLKILNNAVVSDAPIFTYRGLMLDTSKSYLPVSSIAQTIDAMSATKLNILHWHMTSSLSFPFASDSLPGFKKYGPNIPQDIYTLLDIKYIVEYAEVRGVTVLIEVDAPAQNVQGWEWGEEEGKGNLTVCTNAQPFSKFCSHPPCGQLNPANVDSYSTLVQVLKELSGLTRVENLAHLGGDGVDLSCWESAEEVTDMEVYINKGVVGVWELFYQQMFDKLSQERMLPTNVILWSNDLLKRSNFWRGFKNVSFIVQSKGSSTSGEIEKTVRLKFRVVVSSSDVWQVSEPQNWVAVYKHRPWSDLNHQQRKLVLGGEALAWTDHLSLHSVLWPTTAAVAERLWTDPRWGSVPLARLVWLRERLVDIGVPCSPLGPKWCTQNPYQCS